MKKLLLLCFFFICILRIQAQGEEPVFRLELSSNSILLKYDQLFAYGPDWGERIAERVYNYSFQLSAFHRLSSRLELGYGLGYANFDGIAWIDGYYCDGCLQPDIQYVPFSIQNRFKLRIIEAPLELRINVSKERPRISPYFSLGLTPRMFLIYVDDLDNGKIKLKENRFSLGVYAGVGSRFQLSPMWSLNVAVDLMTSRYANQINGRGIVPDSDDLNWLNEWHFKVGISRALK